MIKDIAGQLDQFRSNTKDSKIYQIIASHSDWNITTIFGILLDYPVVYWYEDNVNANTCLSCKDLTNYKLNIVNSGAHLMDHSIYSFTIPMSVIDEPIQNKIDQWISRVLEIGIMHKVILNRERCNVNFSQILSELQSNMSIIVQD